MTDLEHSVDQGPTNAAIVIVVVIVAVVDTADEKYYQLSPSRKWLLQKEDFHHHYHPEGPALKGKGQNESSNGTEVKRYAVWINSAK